MNLPKIKNFLHKFQGLITMQLLFLSALYILDLQLSKNFFFNSILVLTWGISLLFGKIIDSTIKKANLDQEITRKNSLMINGMIFALIANTIYIPTLFSFDIDLNSHLNNSFKLAVLITWLSFISLSFLLAYKFAIVREKEQFHQRERKKKFNYNFDL